MDWTARGCALVATIAALSICGCASPGPPLPPSLKLPEVASGVSAIRVGNEVRLSWKTPERTTDKLLIAEPIAAEICRETVVATRAVAKRDSCSLLVLTEEVRPGESEAVDVLPTELTTGVARLLAYRVLLSNRAGRTAGASAAVYAAAGAAPAAVEELRGRETKSGVVLEWRPEVQGIGNREQGTDTIEIQRTTMPSTTADTSKRATTTATTAGSGLERTKGLPGATKEPAEIWLRVGGGAASRTDAGGTMDRTVQMGETYRYSAQRVRTVELGGQRLEIRSAESAEVVVERKNLFAPETPMGLVAAPGFFGEKGVQQPSINLSWEPNLEARVVGYRVYRREGDGAWQRIDEEPVDGAAYSDRRVVAGHTYSYRVTAVDAAGSESAPSDAVVETAATQ